MVVGLGEWKLNFEGMGASRKKGGRIEEGHIEMGWEKKMMLERRGTKALGLERQMIAGSAEGRSMHSR